MTSQSFCISNLIMKLDMASCMFTFPYPIQWSQLFVKFEVPKIRPHHTLLGNKILKISSLGENHLEVAKCVCDGGDSLGLRTLAFSKLVCMGSQVPRSKSQTWKPSPNFLASRNHKNMVNY